MSVGLQAVPGIFFTEKMKCRLTGIIGGDIVCCIVKAMRSNRSFFILNQ